MTFGTTLVITGTIGPTRKKSERRTLKVWSLTHLSNELMISTTEIYTQEDAQHQNELTLNFAITLENWQ